MTGRHFRPRILCDINQRGQKATDAAERTSLALGAQQHSALGHTRCISTRLRGTVRRSGGSRGGDIARLGRFGNGIGRPLKPMGLSRCRSLGPIRADMRAGGVETGVKLRRRVFQGRCGQGRRLLALPRGFEINASVGPFTLHAGPTWGGGIASDLGCFTWKTSACGPLPVEVRFVV
jgi:hypothetical protein